MDSILYFTFFFFFTTTEAAGKRTSAGVLFFFVYSSGINITGVGRGVWWGVNPGHSKDAVLQKQEVQAQERWRRKCANLAAKRQIRQKDPLVMSRIESQQCVFWNDRTTCTQEFRGPGALLYGFV